jgi:hypothetical protein
MILISTCLHHFIFLLMKSPPFLASLHYCEYVLRVIGVDRMVCYGIINYGGSDEKIDPFYFLANFPPKKSILEITTFIKGLPIVRTCVKCNLRDLVLMNVPWIFYGISSFLLNCEIHYDGIEMG